MESKTLKTRIVEKWNTTGEVKWVCEEHRCQKVCKILSSDALFLLTIIVTYPSLRLFR